MAVSDGPTNEEIVQEYARASVEGNLEALGSLRHPEWTVTWPQSGERVTSSDSYAEIVRRYPGGRPKSAVDRIVGSGDQWVVTGANTVIRVGGTGDAWWSSWTVRYPDGELYHCVDLIELKDSRVFRETVYWAPPFDAPEWRRPFVELTDAP